MTNPHQKHPFDHRVSGFPLLFESAIRNPRCVCIRKSWKSLRISKSPHASQNLENSFPKGALLFLHSTARNDKTNVNTLRGWLGQWVCRKMNLIGRFGARNNCVSLSHIQDLVSFIERASCVCHTCRHNRSPSPEVSDLTRPKATWKTKPYDRWPKICWKQKIRKHLLFKKANTKENHLTTIYPPWSSVPEWPTFKHRCPSASLWRFEVRGQMQVPQNGGSCGQNSQAFGPVSNCEKKKRKHQSWKALEAIFSKFMAYS